MVHVGDLGSIQPNGALRVEGRLTDLIIRGGCNIYSDHIEAFAVRHPLVEMAACFVVADDRLGERVCIAVIGTIEADDLLSHLRAQGLSKFDLPEYFVALEALPTTPSGKILKRELVEVALRDELIPHFVRKRPMLRANR